MTLLTPRRRFDDEQMADFLAEQRPRDRHRILLAQKLKCWAYRCLHPADGVKGDMVPLSVAVICGRRSAAIYFTKGFSGANESLPIPEECAYATPDDEEAVRGGCARRQVRRLTASLIPVGPGFIFGTHLQT